MIEPSGEGVSGAAAVGEAPRSGRDLADLADLAARRHRLLDLGADVAAHPLPHGDHVLNPEMAGDLRARPLRDAAVLVPLVERSGTLAAILTQRAAHLPAHAGQVAFPGGKIDPYDETAAAAALREAEEEIALPRRLAEPVGYGAPYLTNSGYRVFPVVALVSPAARLVPYPGEVDAIFEVPWPFLMNPENHARRAVVHEGRTRHYYEMPFGERRIWGVTAGIVRSLFEQLYG